MMLGQTHPRVLHAGIETEEDMRGSYMRPGDMTMLAEDRNGRMKVGLSRMLHMKGWLGEVVDTGNVLSTQANHHCSEDHHS